MNQFHPASATSLRRGLVAGVIAAFSAGALLLAPITQPVSAAAATSTTMTVKAMTYNMLNAHKHTHEGVDTSDLSWASRKSQIAAWVKWNDPDVIGWQENEVNVTLSDGTTCRQICSISDTKLSDYTFIKADGDIPIAFKTSKFTLVSSGSKQVAEQGVDGATRDRDLVWAVLTDNETGAQFIAFNTHTISGSTASAKTSRIVQTKAVIKQMKVVDPDLATPFVLLGDWNMRNTTTGTDAEPISLLNDAGIVDAETIAAARDEEVSKAASWNGFGITINGEFRYRATKTGNWHIDYTWVPADATVNTWKVSSGPDTRSVKINGTAYPFFSTEVVPSDHSPVVASISYTVAAVVEPTPTPTTPIPTTATPTSTTTSTPTSTTTSTPTSTTTSTPTSTTTSTPTSTTTSATSSSAQHTATSKAGSTAVDTGIPSSVEGNRGLLLGGVGLLLLAAMTTTVVFVVRRRRTATTARRAA